MISYHLRISGDAAAYARGWKWAEVDNVQRLANGISRYPWSPCHWKEGHRTKANFKEAHWLVLDFDSGEMTLEEAVKIFCDATHIIGTTKSHQLPKNGGPIVDRFRVAVKFSKPITRLSDYEFTLHKVGERYPVDTQALDAARFFWPCTRVISMEHDGYLEEPRTAPEGWGLTPEKVIARLEHYQRLGVIPPFARWALSQEIPKGQRNTTWFKAAKDLIRCGWQPEEIYDKIVASPTLKTKDPRLLSEVRACLKSAIKSVATEDCRRG